MDVLLGLRQWCTGEIKTAEKVLCLTQLYDVENPILHLAWGMNHAMFIELQYGSSGLRRCVLTISVLPIWFLLKQVATETFFKN